MTYDYNKNNANNFSVITSYEFSDIVSYLTSKKTEPSQVLETMKDFDSVEYKSKGKYYTVAQSEAWKYFEKVYSKSISTKRIKNMDDLLNSSQNYIDKHKLW